MLRLKRIMRSSFFGFLILIVLTRGGICADSVDIQQVIPQLESEVQRTMLAGEIPSATIALVQDDKIIWTGAFGYSNIWARTPAVTKTVYLIGSTFKTMSMFALLQQMEKGKFKLDERVNDYLEEFKIQGEDPANPVTFRHLLSHTSGLPGDFGPHAVWGDSVPLSLEEYLTKRLKVRNPPLTELVYSNMAFTLIAYLVEKFSGIPYKEYIQKNIFNPLEMEDTAFFPKGNMEERLAIPYIFNTKTNSHVPATRLKANVWPAGIVYGTIIDQAHWLIANLNHGVYKEHRLISEETFEQVMTRQYDKFNGPISDGWLNETTGFGLTWWISEYKKEKLFAHSGSVPGYTAFLVGNLDQKTGFAILTNGNRSHKHLFDLAVKALDLMEENTKSY